MARTPIHPGEILADELEEIGLTAAELACCWRFQPIGFHRKFPESGAIAADTALRLAVISAPRRISG